MIQTSAPKQGTTRADLADLVTLENAGEIVSDFIREEGGELASVLYLAKPTTFKHNGTTFTYFPMSRSVTWTDSPTQA